MTSSLSLPSFVCEHFGIKRTGSWRTNHETGTISPPWCQQLHQFEKILWGFPSLVRICTARNGNDILFVCQEEHMFLAHVLRVRSISVCTYDMAHVFEVHRFVSGKKRNSVLDECSGYWVRRAIHTLSGCGCGEVRDAPAARAERPAPAAAPPHSSPTRPAQPAPRALPAPTTARQCNSTVTISDKCSSEVSRGRVHLSISSTHSQLLRVLVSTPHLQKQHRSGFLFLPLASFTDVLFHLSNKVFLPLNQQCKVAQQICHWEFFFQESAQCFSLA